MDIREPVEEDIEKKDIKIVLKDEDEKIQLKKKSVELKDNENVIKNKSNLDLIIEMVEKGEYRIEDYQENVSNESDDDQ